MTTIFDEIDRLTSTPDTITIKHAPFGYAGGKSRSVNQIIPHLPYRKSYIEPFGGSATILLNRQTSPLDVYNDRYGGVVAFFRCMRDQALTEKLLEWVEWTLNSKEDFLMCKGTKDHPGWDVNDPVERAGRWLYLANYSFSSVMRNWGRARTSAGLNGKMFRKIQQIRDVAHRFRTVQVENQDWFDCISYYDFADAVFYLDPPYINTDAGAYTHDMSDEDSHIRMLDLIQQCKGFFAVSGYPNPIYDKYDWDDCFEWQTVVTAKTNANAATANQVGHSVKATEVLWIKESR